MTDYQAVRDFVSPVYGNVVAGQKLPGLDEAVGKHFIELGLVEELKAEKPKRQTRQKPKETKSES